jgi:NagD protein
MMRAARKMLGLTADQTTMIGDTMETDILGGAQMGYQTVLVLSGGTRREDLARFAYRPDIVVESVASLIDALPDFESFARSVGANPQVAAPNVPPVPQMKLAPPRRPAAAAF